MSSRRSHSPGERSKLSQKPRSSYPQASREPSRRPREKTTRRSEALDSVSSIQSQLKWDTPGTRKYKEHTKKAPEPTDRGSVEDDVMTEWDDDMSVMETFGRGKGAVFYRTDPLL